MKNINIGFKTESMKCFSMKKFLLIWMLGTSMMAQAQLSEQVKKLLPNPVIPSPNVAALGRYGEYPVTFFTGLPEISIPIYEVKSGSLTVPITLSYHASGVRYTDQATWVGLGWSLSAGGQVSRQTNGKADEAGYYTGTLISNPTLCDNYDFIENSFLGAIDTEPDMFSYTFPGKSGKFMLKHGQAPFLIPYEPIQLTTDFVNGQVFDRFNITDEVGRQFQFGKNSAGVSAKELTIADNISRSTNSVTAWHLMEMIAPNSNDKITFSYQSLGSTVVTDLNYHVTINDECDTDGATNCPPKDGNVFSITTSSSTTTFAVKEIFFEGGKVEFVKSASTIAGSYYLDAIKIFQLINGNYQVIKVVKFNYSAFKGINTYSNTDLRLKLDNVEFRDNSSAVLQRYAFNYFTNTFSWDMPTGSRKRDLWGFYNGANNEDLIPVQTISYQQSVYASPTTITIGGAIDRTVHPEFLTEGVLEKITYPTGGYTIFEFEPHQFNENGIKNAGGLRVKKIVSTESAGSPAITKTYKYGSGESGTGVKNFYSSQYYFNSTVTNENLVCYGIGYYINRSRSFTSASAAASAAFDGTPVFYPVVTEYYGTTSNNIGKIIYEFDNGYSTPDQLQFVSAGGNMYKNYVPWKRGHLTKKTVFGKSGNKLSETNIGYEIFQENNKTVGFATYQARVFTAARCDNSCTNQSARNIYPNEFYFSHLNQASGKYVQKTITEYTYQPDDVTKYSSKVRTNSFDPIYLQSTEVSETTSNNNETLVTKTKYPFSYTFSGSETGSARATRVLKEKNVISLPIEQYTLKKIGSTSYVTGGQVTRFMSHPVNINHVQPEVIYLLETDATIPESNFTPTSVNNYALTMDTKYKPAVNAFYDLKGNLLQAQRTNDVVTGYQWGYNNTLVLAEATNAQNNRYGTISPSTASKAFSVMGPVPATSQVTFTVECAGSVIIKVGTQALPMASITVSYSGDLGQSSFTLTNSQSCTASQQTILNVAPGTYTINFSATSSTAGVNVCGEIVYPVYLESNFTGTKEFFYEGFEEGTYSNANNNSDGHTGRQYKIGDYTPTFVLPNTRNYIVEYWYLNGTQWVYTSKPYTGTSTILNEGTGIDDVRIYPADGRMKSYTYDPLVGITSVIDENGVTVFYDYDSFGRLWRVRNDKGGIEKQYTYNYKSN